MFHAKRMEQTNIEYEAKEDLVMDDDVAENAFRLSLKFFTMLYM